MICPNCGADNPAGSKWCSACGNSLEAQTPPPAQQPNPYAQQQNPYGQQQQQNPYGQPNPYNNNQYGNQPPPQNYQNDAAIQAAQSRATQSLICGIIGLFIMIVGIIALVQGFSARKTLAANNQPTGTAVAGIVLGFLSLIGWVIGIIITIAVISSLGSVIDNIYDSLSLFIR